MFKNKPNTCGKWFLLTAARGMQVPEEDQEERCAGFQGLQDLCQTVMHKPGSRYSHFNWDFSQPHVREIFEFGETPKLHFVWCAPLCTLFVGSICCRKILRERSFVCFSQGVFPVRQRLQLVMCHAGPFQSAPRICDGATC